MTTVDNALPAGWVERAETRAAQSTVDARRVLLAILMFVPLAIGAIVGILVRGGVLAFAVAQEGYAMGRSGSFASGGTLPAGRRE